MIRGQYLGKLVSEVPPLLMSFARNLCTQQGVPIGTTVGSVLSGFLDTLAEYGLAEYGGEVQRLNYLLEDWKRLKDAATLVHQKFSRDREQGYQSKDRDYAVSILAMGLHNHVEWVPDYQHYKGGKYRLLNSAAMWEETWTPMVVYMNDAGLWIGRQKDEFFGKVMVVSPTAPDKVLGVSRFKHL